MDLHPGDRIIYRTSYGRDDLGTYLKTTKSPNGEIRHWMLFDGDYGDETYVTNFKLIKRLYTATDHDLQEIS